MASISSGPDGRRTIQFYGKDNKRRSIRLGKMPAKLAEQIKLKVEALNVAAITGMSIDGETAQWVAKVGDDLADRLAAVGLIAERGRGTLGEFIDRYILERGDVKRSTRLNLEQVRDKLVRHFGPDRALRSITHDDGGGWLRRLREDYAPGTLGRRLGIAKQFLRAAVRAGLLDKNPFAELKAPGGPDESRKVFVSQADALKVIDTCPPDLRLVVALARFGGLRIPSELEGLTWPDVNFEKARIRVTSPKTEHHAGKGERWIPLFPELLPHLQEAFDRAPEGEVHLFHRHSGVNLRTALVRAIRRAGLTPWPKLFVNLRSSRETELVEQFPLHVVTAWLGHGIRVAERHYLQVTDEHFERAAKSGAVALRNAVPQLPAPVHAGPQPSPEGVAGCGSVRVDASPCSVLSYARQDSNL
jgi:integrase